MNSKGSKDMKTSIKLISIHQYLVENRATATLIKNKKHLLEVDLLQLYEDKKMLYKLAPNQIEAVCCLAIFLIQEKGQRAFEEFKKENRKK